MFSLCRQKHHIISVGYRIDTKKMFTKYSLYVAENIIIILNVGSTTDTRQCSENVLFVSLKTSYHQRWLHNRHKDNVQESKRNENCYKLQEQWFRPSVLPPSLSSEMNTFLLPRPRHKTMPFSSWNSWICVQFERILMYVFVLVSQGKWPFHRYLLCLDYCSLYPNPHLHLTLVDLFSDRVSSILVH